MTEPDGERPPASESFWHRRVPGIRYLAPIACIIAGIGSLVLFAGAVDETWRLVSGLVLLPLGLVSVPVVVWMERRGL